MPNNDLGTAHGRIRIDFEDKGTAAALAAIQRMQKQFELLNNRVAKIEKTLNKKTASVEKNTDAVKKAKKETDSWLFTLAGGERIVKAFDKDIVDLTQDITRLYSKFGEARQKFKPLENAYKVLDRYQRIKLERPIDSVGRALSALKFNRIAEGEKRLVAFHKALNSVGWGMAALKSIGIDVIIGRGSAMRSMPTWTRYVHNFSLSLRTLGAAGLAAGVALNTGFITKFLNTNVFRNIVLQAGKAGNAFERLGSISTKIFGKNLFGNLELQLKNSESIITRWTKNTSHTLNSASRGFNAWFKPVAAAAKSIQSFTLGIGLMAAGISDIGSRFAWLGRIPKPLLVGLATTFSVVLPAALQIFDKGLIGTSNILMGLLSGVKQLSGGLLALPGAFAAVGATAITLKTIFLGLEDQFKDVFSADPVEAAEALAKLPEHLKPMGTALKEVADKFREMQVAIQKIAFKGIEDQIRSLSQKYIPLLQTGMSNVTFALRGAKDEFVKFLEESQTQKDVNTIFNRTTEILLNLKDAIRPISDGLRDIATVGTQFFAEWSTGLGTVSQRFAEWARANRESGQLLSWMREAKEGARDLVNGTKELGKGLWNILTMFRSNTGVNFLDRYAASMEKFNNAIKQSRQGGLLFDFSSAVKGLGESSNKIEVFKTIFQSFLDMMKSVAPAIQNVSDAFSSIFIPSLEDAMDLLGLFAKVMSALNLDDFTGVVLGLVAAVKLLPTFLKPLWDGSRIILGFGMTLLSASKTIKAFDDGLVKVLSGLEKFPLGGAKAAASIMNVRNSLNGLVGVIARIAGPIAIALTAFTALWAIMRAGRESAKAFDEQIKTNSKNVTKFGEDLTKAFYADNGKIGTTVMDQVSLGMETMLRDLEDTASKAPGVMDHLADYFSKPKVLMGNIVNGGFFGESEEINRRQAEGDAAKLAAEKYRELTKQNVDLSAVISGSQSGFDARIENLRVQGKAGNALADVLVKQRQEFNSVYDAMQKLGPSGVQLAKGLDEIARAGGDATTKLNGLRNVLTGLGFLKTDALEAAAAYTTTLGDLASQIEQLKADGADFSSVWKADGTLDDTNKSAAKLIPILSQVSNAYLQAAASGKNVDEINGRLNQTLEQVAPSLNTTADALKQYFKQNMGAAPIAVRLALQMDGVQDQFAKDISNLLLQLYRQTEFNVPVRLGFNTEDAAHQFDSSMETLLNQDFFDQDGRTIVVKAGVQLDANQLAAMQQYLADHANIQTGTGPIVDPAKIPVAVQQPVGVPPAVTPQAPPPVEATTAIPPWMPNAPRPVMTPPSNNPLWPAPVEAPSVPDLTPKLDEASAKVDEVDGKMQKLVSSDRQIQLNVDKVNEAGNKIDELEKKFATKNLKADVQINGIEKLQEASTSAQNITNSLNTTFTTFTDQIKKAFGDTVTKIGELSNQVTEIFTNLAVNASNAGSKFVDAFADGLSSNPRAIQAAQDMAERVLENFHRSPPKKGPLAEHGDAARYGGSMFVESYARGLKTAAPAASDAAGTVAGAAVGGMNNAPGAKAGQFLGQLLEMTNFFSSIVDVVGKVTDSVFKLAKFISDPMGKGTFFGRSTGYRKTVSDAELQKRRNDKDQQALTSTLESGRRNTTDFEERLRIRTNAENAVVEDQPGYQSSDTVKTVGAMIKEAFPEIASLGGARPDALPYHREGNALDVMIPDFDTPEGKELGDRINNWALANARKLGIDYTIWQDFYQPTALGGGGAGNFMGNQDATAGHFDHVHLNFKSGTNVDMSGIEMNPEEMQNYQTEKERKARQDALTALQETYGPPVIPGENEPAVEPTLVQFGENGRLVMTTPHGTKDVPLLGPINPDTGQPWTPQETEDFKRRNLMEYTLPEGMTMESFQALLDNPNEFNAQTGDDALNTLAENDVSIAKALAMKDSPQDFPVEEVASTLASLDETIARLRETDTAGSRKQASLLEGVQSSIMEGGGFTKSQNPIDMVAGIVSQAVGVTSDILGTIVTGIEAIGSAEDIASTLVRGVSGTGDVGRIVDNVQKFLELGAKVAGSVSSVSSLMASVVGAAGSGDTSGASQGVAAALGTVSTIAGLVQAGYETANAVIDLSQEAMRIAGTYVGDFLGFLVGGVDGPLAGNVKFLLDQKTNQLMAYAADNPLDKRAFDIPFTNQDASSRQQMIGNINVYGGPGSDPRDLTRQMMYQVNSAQYAGALAY